MNLDENFPIQLFLTFAGIIEEQLNLDENILIQLFLSFAEVKEE